MADDRPASALYNQSNDPRIVESLKALTLEELDELCQILRERYYG